MNKHATTSAQPVAITIHKGTIGFITAGFATILSSLAWGMVSVLRSLIQNNHVYTHEQYLDAITPGPQLILMLIGLGLIVLGLLFECACKVYQSSR